MNDPIMAISDMCLQEIELSDIPPEEIEISSEIEANNNSFLETLATEIAALVTPCQCDPARAVSQSLADDYKFSVILYTMKGLYTKKAVVIRECKKCHNISMYGNGNDFALLLAKLQVDAINAHEIDVMVDDKPITETDFVNLLRENGIPDVEMVPIEAPPVDA